MRSLPLVCFLCVSPLAAQWQILNSTTTADLRGIDNAGHGSVWASGTQGTVLRSTDDGATWTRCTTPPDATNLDFRGIHAFDAHTAMVMSSGKGDLSRVYKTTDSCVTWTLQHANSEADGFWDAMVFQHGNYGYAIGDAKTGILIGDPVRGQFQTDAMILGDGWYNDTAGCKAAPDEGAFAASNSSVFVFGSRRYILGTGGKSGASILISPLMFNTEATGPCRRIAVPIGDSTESSGVFSLFFRDLHNGVAVGGDYRKPDATKNVAALTNDMGLHWTAAITPPHGYRSSVAYNETSHIWISVGPNGTDISTDDGRNWQALKPNPQAGDAPDADQHWNALSLPFVVGPHGRIGKLKNNALPKKGDIVRRSESERRPLFALLTATTPVPTDDFSELQ